MQIEIKIDAKEFETKLTQLTAKLKNLKPLMEQMGAVLVDMTEENFSTQSFMGRSWKPWAPSTAKRRSGGRILQDSGDLAGSISYLASSHSVSAGTNKIYAAIHQFGGKAGRGRKSAIPSRPFLPFDQNGVPSKVVRTLTDEIEDYLDLS